MERKKIIREILTEIAIIMVIICVAIPTFATGGMTNDITGNENTNTGSVISIPTINDVNNNQNTGGVINIPTINGIYTNGTTGENTEEELSYFYFKDNTEVVQGDFIWVIHSLNNRKSDKYKEIKATFLSEDKTHNVTLKLNWFNIGIDDSYFDTSSLKVGKKYIMTSVTLIDYENQEHKYVTESNGKDEYVETFGENKVTILPKATLTNLKLANNNKFKFGDTIKFEVEYTSKMEMIGIKVTSKENSSISYSFVTYADNATIKMEKEICGISTGLKSGNYYVSEVDLEAYHEGLHYRKNPKDGELKLNFDIEFTIDDLPFRDVNYNNWYYTAVKEAQTSGVIKGYDDTTFAPNDKLSRAMAVTILYRMYGSPNVADESRFSDVKTGKWYTKAINWAATNEIVKGYDGSDKFGPNDNIKRQDLVGMLRNFTKFRKEQMKNSIEQGTTSPIGKAWNLNLTADLSIYNDANDISSYANSAMQWAVGSGVIKGSNGKLNPKGNATRAEMASFLYKYNNSTETSGK